MDRSGRDNQVHQGLEGVDRMEVDAEGGQGMARHRVVDSPVEDRHGQGEGALHHMEEPLQSQGEAEAARKQERAQRTCRE